MRSDRVRRDPRTVRATLRTMAGGRYGSRSPRSPAVRWWRRCASDNRTRRALSAEAGDRAVKVPVNCRLTAWCVRGRVSDTEERLPHGGPVGVV